MLPSRLDLPVSFHQLPMRIASSPYRPICNKGDQRALQTQLFHLLRLISLSRPHSLFLKESSPVREVGVGRKKEKESAQSVKQVRSLAEQG